MPCEALRGRLFESKSPAASHLPVGLTNDSTQGFLEGIVVVVFLHDLADAVRAIFLFQVAKERLTLLVKQEARTNQGQALKGQEVVMQEGVPDHHLRLGIPPGGPPLGQTFCKPQRRIPVVPDASFLGLGVDLGVHEYVHQLVTDDLPEVVHGAVVG